MIAKSEYPRGSEWRQWDLHIHSPASYEWSGPKFTGKGLSEADLPLVDGMIGAINAAGPAVFAVMDYWHFDGWFALKNRLAQNGSPTLTKTVFPGIELRLAAPMRGRLNAHVIFSDEARDQQLRDFLSCLRLEVTNQPLSEDALIHYARRVDKDFLAKHGIKKSDVEADDRTALIAGCKIAELNCNSYKEAIRNVPDGLAVGFMPFDTSDGLQQIDHLEHYAYALGLFKSSPIFEARDEATWNAFVGRRTEGNKRWFDSFLQALDGKPRLPVSGSDAHRFSGTPGDNNNRGYGDFPSSRITWIKADPTWFGLLQAIKEPEKRCHIGGQPPKLEKITSNKTFYIDRTTLTKRPGSTLSDRWFDGVSIPINPDLVSIIGNKGSGKSALADVIALLGNSQQTKYFSFLKTDRFRGKSGEPARQFNGRLEWLAGDPCEANLADDPQSGAVELVRYIPQGRFEALCNEHVAGKSDAFERELRGVIFSHIPLEDRPGALDFEQLTEAQEKNYRAQLSELRKNLGTLNRTIVSIEDQLHPDTKRNIEEQLRLKQGQLDELQKTKPPEVPRPSESLTPKQQEADAKLAELTHQQNELIEQKRDLLERQSAIATRRQALRSIIDRLRLFESQIAQLKSDLNEDLLNAGLAFEKVVTVKIDRAPLQMAIAGTDAEAKAIAETLKQCTDKQDQVSKETEVVAEALNEPQRRYQTYLAAMSAWQSQNNQIVGDTDQPDSCEGLKARLKQIEQLPDLLAQRRIERKAISNEIYTILGEQRAARAALFKPLQDIIEANTLIRDQFRLQFQAQLSLSSDALAENIFSIVKNAAGAIRGEDESRAAIRERCDRHDLNAGQDAATALISDLIDLLTTAARVTQPDGEGIRAICRKDRQPTEAYDYIFGLEYVEPKYTLLFQDSPIEQLSPGQRGALLLIFYLLVDKGRNPIILDQPEENLDNETIVSLLVPVITEAKKNRQIIMVTHNPNLAVVCDAEQIIRAEFDRPNASTMSYQSGSIESHKINEQVVVVLEGTKPAFDNRREKYH